MKRKAIIVSEDSLVIRFLQPTLDALDIETVICSSVEGLDVSDCLLVLLNIDLKKSKSIDTIRSLRCSNNDIFISVMSDACPVERVTKALDAGADECFVKPFNIQLILAQHRAAFRRLCGRKPQENAIIESGHFTYDLSTLRLYKNGVEIPLSSKENSIIKLFMDNAGAVFSKDYIYSKVWGSTIIDENAIMVYMNRIRQKIEDDPSKPKYLQTVRGVGYRLNTK